MKGYQRPEDLAGAGVIIEQFEESSCPRYAQGAIPLMYRRAAGD